MEPEIAPKLSLTPVSTYLHETLPTMRLSRFDIGLVIWQQDSDHATHGICPPVRVKSLMTKGPGALWED